MRILLVCLLGAVSCQYGQQQKPCASVVSNAVPASTLRAQGILLKGFLEQSASGALSGFVPDLLNALSVLQGFKFNLTVRADGSYGETTLTSASGGITDALLKNEIDLAAAHIFVHPGRLNVMDFLISVTTDQVRPIVKKGTSLNNIKYLVRKDSSIEKELLQPATTASLKAIYQNIKDNNGYVSTVQEGIDRAAAGGVAYLANVRSTKDLVAANGQVEYAATVLQETPIAFGVQQGSAWRQPLNIGIATLASQGVLAELIDKHNLRLPA